MIPRQLLLNFRFSGLIFVYLLSITSVLGQAEDPLIPNIIPPSPTASSLGKYGEMPVSLYSGIPNISIPIYELPSRKLTLPISLSYHASGVKVEDVASWVGIGWSLNAGGVITRSVRGIPDEGFGGASNGFFQQDGFPTQSDLDAEPNDAVLLWQFAEGHKDPEPDVYYYNFNGRSGQLMFDANNNFYTTSADKIKFEKTIVSAPNGEWILVDEQGIRYIFNNIENTNYSLNDINGTVISAWYLTKIVSADLKDTIELTYAPKNASYHRPSTQTYTWYNEDGSNDWAEGANPNLGWQGDYNISTGISGNATLSEIITKQGRAEFITTTDRTDIIGEELREIKIYNQADELIRSFHFEYDYNGESQNGGRLYLRSVAEKGINNTSKPAYQFFYYGEGNLPPRDSKQQDYWGYYNGATGNTHLIPNISASTIFPSDFTFSDRNPVESKMIYGSLQKIEYPTGGYSEFEYEAHRYDNGISIFDAPATYTLTAINGEEKIYEFTIHHERVTLEVNFNGFREEDNYDRPFIKIEEQQTDGSWQSTPSLTWEPPYPSQDDHIVMINESLSPYKTYRIITGSTGCGTPPNCATPGPNSFSTNVKVSYFDQGSNYIDFGGGIRIKEIRDYDGLNSGEINVRKYQYYNGKLATIPVYYYQYTRPKCEVLSPFLLAQPGPIQTNPICANPATAIINSASSQSMVNLGASQGSHVVYPKVVEIYGRNGENGSTENHFYFNGGLASTNPIPPFVPQDNYEFWNGKLLKQIKYDNRGRKVEAIINEYEDDGGTLSVNYHANKGIKVLTRELTHFFDLENNICMEYYWKFYTVQSRWVYLDSTSHISYFYDDNNTVDSTIVDNKYLYENKDHIQVTKTTTHNSTGEKIEVTKKYALDPLADTEMSSAVINELIAKNMIGIPLKTDTWVNGQKIKGIIQNYDKFNGGSLLKVSSVQVLEGASYNSRIRYPTYDEDGNIQTVSKEGDMKISFLWGYNNTLPIAKVDNASSDEIAFASFETDADKGNWSYTGTSYVETSAKTGNRAWNGGNLTWSGSGEFIISLWSSGSGTPQVNGQSSDISFTEGEWTYHEWKINASGMVTVTPNSNAIDDVRLYPTDAQMMTYTYDPLTGITSVTDPNGIITYYDYDDLGRLKKATDYKGNIVQMYEYYNQDK